MHFVSFILLLFVAKKAPSILTDSRYEEINAEITKNLNKNKEFPDYHDVYSWILKANEESNLELE